MSSNTDETTIVRTLAPHVFPAEPISLDFDWCAELSNRAEAQVRQTVFDALKLAELESAPAVAIVRRLGVPLSDDTLNVAVYDCRGKKLCALRIADNGFGELTLWT